MISLLVRSPFTRLRSSMKSEGLQRMIGSWDWVTSARLPVGLNIAFAESRMYGRSASSVWFFLTAIFLFLT